MKNYRVRRLDRRYNGGDVFRHRVEIDDHIKNPEKTDLYRRMQEWCRTTWGASSEVRHARMFRINGLEHNVHWCYDNEWFTSFHIYLRGDEELALFELKWPVDR